MNIKSEAPEIIEGNRPDPNWPAVGSLRICNLKVDGINACVSTAMFYSRITSDICCHMIMLAAFIDYFAGSISAWRSTSSSGNNLQH